MFLWDLDEGGFAGVVLFKKGNVHVSIVYIVLTSRFSLNGRLWSELPDLLLGLDPRLRSLGAGSNSALQIDEYRHVTANFHHYHPQSLW